jgi:hypothetical protein
LKIYMKNEIMCTKYVAIILSLLVLIPELGKAEAWEVTTNKNDPNPRYYAGEQHGYYRRVPDKEIYYAPDAEVVTDGKDYYYRFRNTMTLKKAFPEPNEANVEYERIDPNVRYTTSLIYIPEGSADYYNPAPVEEQPAPAAEAKAKNYPIYFDN